MLQNWANLDISSIFGLAGFISGKIRLVCLCMWQLESVVLFLGHMKSCLLDCVIAVVLVGVVVVVVVVIIVVVAVCVPIRICHSISWIAVRSLLLSFRCNMSAFATRSHP